MGAGAGTEKSGGGKGVDCVTELVRDRIGFVSIVIEKMMVKWCFGLYNIVIYIVRVPQEADCEKVGVFGNAVVMFCGLSRLFCILFRQEGRTRK